MSPPWAIAAEMARLEQVLPDGMRLRWLVGTQTYQLTYKIEGEIAPKALRKISRSDIHAWTNTERVLNYVARRALAKAELPVSFRTRDGTCKVIMPSFD